jgi:thiol-disulfide isomerase/thioredoxin
MGHSTIYPMGTTIYNPEKSYNGYTVFQALEEGALLIDMNGKEVHLWKGLHGFPNKILPGGYVMGHRGSRNPDYGVQDMVDLVQVDWDGKVVWEFNKYEYIEDSGEEPRWMARAHHDYQREGSSTGYYSPDQEPMIESGNTLLLVHKNVYNNEISDKQLLDDVIIEVNWKGEIIWEWACNEHFEELGFSEEAKNVLFRNPNMRKAGGGMGDWMHINSMSVLGENPFYDEGDERFHPDNIIWDARESNIIAIIDKKTKAIVWKIGPNYQDEEIKHLGQIIGQHHAHMIPKGLPGAGNILVFDNGGWAGYGAPNPSSLFGQKNAWRDYSRVLEIHPVTLEIVWKYTPKEALFQEPTDSSRFYSPYISSAQRLPNGNTLITEGAYGRLFEVTTNHEIVWEYISPYMQKEQTYNMVYRAYRVPYHWVPQLEKPEEKEIVPIDITEFRVPNAAKKGCDDKVSIEGTLPFVKSTDTLCIEVNKSAKKEKVYEVDKESFNSLEKNKLGELKDIEKAVVLFGGTHCIHCKVMHKVILNHKKDLKDAILYYIDTDKEPELVEEFGIRGIPTVILFSRGEEKGRIYGEKSGEELIEFYNQNLGGDSNESK